MLIFLKLYLSHLVADFLLQRNWVAENKRNPRALLELVDCSQGACPLPRDKRGQERALRRVLSYRYSHER